jgi:hypothetical protein
MTPGKVLDTFTLFTTTGARLTAFDLQDLNTVRDAPRVLAQAGTQKG